MARRAKPKEMIVDKSAVELYKTILKEVEKTYEIDDTILHIANDIALLEQMKQQYLKEIRERGVMVKWVNGKFQEGERENPLLKEVPKLVEQQRKLLNELKLTPASKKVILQPAGGEADEFDRF